MKKIVFVLLAVALMSQPAEAQFLKKLFKKKAKTERKTTNVADGTDDSALVAMMDVTALSDNSNNRNAFMGIPLGIMGDRFEKLLLEKGFVGRSHEGKQTAKSYIYDGEVYGTRAMVTLAVSDQTGRVYAVDVADETIYNSEKAVQKRFQQLKDELRKVYGAGYVDNQGEEYTIQTQLACNHTDLVGLGVCLLQNPTVKGAHSVLRSYDYTLGKTTSKMLSASFLMGHYTATALLARRKQSITAITLTATDDIEAVQKDLGTNGFTSDDQKIWRQGKMTAVVTTDKEGRVVLSLR